MTVDTQPLVFQCQGDDLVGMLHPTTTQSSRGVLVIVGGPQYRAGSHRQFVHLARGLAAHGFPVLRFDYRGMGDSGGDQRDFEIIAEDIRAAIDAFATACPAVQKVVIFGLCDAASAAMFYAPTDPRVSGLILLNPWVRTAHTLARSYVSNYYSRRIFQRDFWAKLLGGDLNIGAALKSFFATVWKGMNPAAAAGDGQGNATPLPVRMLSAWKAFTGPSLIILSGNDLTAGEFEITAQAKPWQEALSRMNVRQLRLADADHTFSRLKWKDQVASACVAWLESW